MEELTKKSIQHDFLRGYLISRLLIVLLKAKVITLFLPKRRRAFLRLYNPLMCNGVALLVECKLEVQRPEVRTPSGAQEKIVRDFPSQKCCAVSLSVCPTRVYTHT